MSARRAVLALALVLSACANSDSGYGVRLTAQIDPSISDARLGDIRRLDVSVSGAETFSTGLLVTDQLAQRQARILYRPKVAGGMLGFQVTARDAMGAVLGTSTVTTILLQPGSVVPATVVVVAGVGPNGDMALVTDGATDLVTDQQGSALDGGLLDGPPAVVDADTDEQVPVVDGGNDLTVIAPGDLRAPPSDFTGVMLDLVPPADQAAPVDLVMTADLVKPVDLVVPPDLVIPPDLVAAADLVGSIGFGAPRAYSVGLGPIGVRAIDVTADGILDLVVASSGSNSLVTLVGDGRGNFVARPAVMTSGTPLALDVGELNGDAYPDAVVAVAGSFLGFDAYRSTGAGTFALLGSSTIPTAPVALGVTDFTGDGLADIVLTTVSGIGSGTAFTFTNSGGGASFLNRSQLGCGEGVGAVSFADWNSDTAIDLSVGGATFFAGRLGGSNFNRRLDLVMGAASVHGTVAVDVNRDGRADLVAADAASGQLLVALNTTQAGNCCVISMANPVAYASGKQPWHVAAGDFNGDGIPDLVNTNRGGGDVSVFMNRGGGALVGPTLVNVGSGTSPSDVATGDFNRDGKADLVVTSDNQSFVYVLLAQ